MQWKHAMEALIALVVLVLLAIPLLLVVALVMIAGLRRRVAALEGALAAAPAVRPVAAEPAPDSTASSAAQHATVGAIAACSDRSGTAIG